MPNKDNGAVNLDASVSHETLSVFLLQFNLSSVANQIIMNVGAESTWLDLGWGLIDVDCGEDILPKKLRLEIAIACLERACEAYKQSPELLARTHVRMAEAWKALPTDDLQKKYTRMKECYEAGIEYYTKERNPERWALLHANAAASLALMPAGDKIDNQTRAIEHWESALDVWTLERFPEEHKSTIRNIQTVRSNMRSVEQDKKCTHKDGCEALAEYQVIIPGKGIGFLCDFHTNKFRYMRNSLGIAIQIIPMKPERVEARK
jgi:hypothetical protein